MRGRFSRIHAHFNLRIPPFMKTIRWGIIGPGSIARKFAQDIRVVPGCSLESVAGRDARRAGAFANANGLPRHHASVRELAEDAGIDAVYIATPHTGHFESAKLMVAQGKAVLVEKPFTVNSREAVELIQAATDAGVFLMEALWTRFLPVYEDIQQWLADGAIGRVRMVSAAFCVRGNQDASLRWLNPALAGGALLDLGVYCLAMQRFAVGAAPLSSCATAVFAPSGVDELLSASVSYPGGVLGQFSCGFAAHGDTSMTIAGESGTIRVPVSFFAARTASLVVGGESRTIERPFLAGGFEYQIAEACRCLRAGLLESPRMPLAETLETMNAMDSMRRAIGLVYPGEVL